MIISFADRKNLNLVGQNIPDKCDSSLGVLCLCSALRFRRIAASGRLYNFFKFFFPHFFAATEDKLTFKIQRAFWNSCLKLR